jgi:hypothetical protein
MLIRPAGSLYFLLSLLTIEITKPVIPYMRPSMNIEREKRVNSEDPAKIVVIGNTRTNANIPITRLANPYLSRLSSAIFSPPFAKF